MRRATSSIPPAVKRHTTDRDIKVNADIVAIGEAFNRAQTATLARIAALEAQLQGARAQIAALDGHVIAMHAWASRNPWLRSPGAKLIATVLGAAAGAYAAMKGLR